VPGSEAFLTAPRHQPGLFESADTATA